jgi:hypothetical protein
MNKEYGFAEKSLYFIVDTPITRYLQKHQNIVKKLIIVKEILFYIFTISFILFCVDFYLPLEFYLKKIDMIFFVIFIYFKKIILIKI